MCKWAIIQIVIKKSWIAQDVAESEGAEEGEPLEQPLVRSSQISSLEADEIGEKIEEVSIVHKPHGRCMLHLKSCNVEG